MQFETFRRFGSYDESNMTHDEPSSFNGMCRVVKYRVTIEEVDEYQEVIHARIQKLWDDCTNHHEWGCIQAAAKKHGLELKPRDRNTKGQD